MMLLLHTPALAHKVTLFAWVEGDIIHTQSKYMGGKRPKQGQIEVFEPNGNLLLMGKTDDQGRFSFKTPQKTDLQIVLTTEPGHRAVWNLLKNEFMASGNGAPDKQISDQNSADIGNPNQDPAGHYGLSIYNMSKEELTNLIEGILDNKLVLLKQQVRSMQTERISLKDVVGGIGYILGLVGLVAYLKNRPSKNKEHR